MNTREISCGNCHNKVMGTPDSKNTLCQSCESLISIEVRKTVPKGRLCFCWKTRLQENKSLHAALPKPDRKLNPMTNNIGVHLPTRAVLCGVSYQKKKHKLKGTINDVNRMKSLLTDHFGFLETSICVLTVNVCKDCQKEQIQLTEPASASYKYVTILLYKIKQYKVKENLSTGACIHCLESRLCLSELVSCFNMSCHFSISMHSQFRGVRNNSFIDLPKNRMKEEEDDPNLIPTKENMQKALRWLVADCKSGDSLVFYFSGHGLRQPDFDMDEIDGYDETICPSDFMTAGMILDNDINNTIVKPLKEGVKLHAIIDACHSGTILDLEHVYDRIPKRWVDNKPPSGVRKSTDGGLAISLSACADDQMASDTTAFSRNKMTGAMTYIFDQTIRQNPGITYGNLLEKMHEQIKHANSNITGCLLRMFCHKLIQETQLSSSTPFNVDTEKFNL